MPAVFTAQARLRMLAAAWLSMAGCAHATVGTGGPDAPADISEAEAPPAPARCKVGDAAAGLPEVDSATLVERLGTGVDRYELTAGLWLEGQPILVNGPYDFALAMTMQGIGPAVAAGQRKEANETMAAALAPVKLAAPLRDELEALAACGLHAYALLWRDGDEASLRVVIDQFTREGDGWLLRRSEAFEMGNLPLQGEGSWTSDGLTASMHGAVQVLLSRLGPRAE